MLSYGRETDVLLSLYKTLMFGVSCIVTCWLTCVLVKWSILSVMRLFPIAKKSLFVHGITLVIAGYLVQSSDHKFGNTSHYNLVIVG